MKVVQESNKEYFKPGDIIQFKGFENEEQQLEMRVLKLCWVEEDGVPVKRNGKLILEGVLVGWHNDKFDWIEKLVDTRAIYKVERTGKYHLIEAKKWFFNKGQNAIVTLINQILNSL